MIEVSLEISLIILAGHSFTWDGQIFNGIRNLIDEKSKISKPIYNCPICMTPWWGTLLYWIVFNGFSSDLGNTGDIIRTWFVTIGAATGFAVLYVIAIHAKDYFQYRTPKEEETCCPTESAYQPMQDEHSAKEWERLANKVIEEKNQKPQNY